MKRLSRLMLLANLLSTLFYAMSYPYIYAETVKMIPHYYISFEQIFACIGTIIFCKLWNKYSDKLFRHYCAILCAEIAADIFLFGDVLIRGDLSFYFLLNVIIFSTITNNISCASTKMRAIVNPSEKEREQFDNNSRIVCSAATLSGAAAAIMLNLSLDSLFIMAFTGNIIDNIFYLYIYYKIKENRYDNSNMSE